ncbi:MAG TPA: nuclear transport factor 2 family protein [Pyrinomonadaceae bacterium]|nr:nuclear transport factor 2 family protein [Pyrinomonadaceae bacterium]
MKRIFSAAIVTIVLALGVNAQKAAAHDELTRLLNEFLHGASRNDPAVHDRFWASDLIYTRSAGVRLGKDEIMRDVRSAPAPKPDDPKVAYSAEDIRIQQYGDTAIVAFRLVARTQKDGASEVTNYLNTGTFLKRNNTWQAVAWQSTKMAPATADKK